jgi:translation initiation factor 3 subunit D|uniref:Eukaryotic translation initiation factor 3 subunit 7 n=1 Tax=Eutreptiella gymnastica TaxID=73025 RepID=A0A7S4GJB8_9EUGL
MAFALPTTHYHPDGWGPPPTKGMDEMVGDIPYMPYNKADRFGRVADWTGMYQNMRYNPKQGQYAQQAGAYFSGAMRDEDETGFQYVETSQRTTQPRFTRFTRHFNQRGRGRGTDGRGAGGGGGFRHGRGRMQLPQRQSKYRTAMRQDFQRRTWIHRSASVEVRPTWKVVHQFSLADLSKLDCPLPEEPKDLKIQGSLDWYDPTYDRVNLRQPVKLGDCSSKSFHSVTTTEDPTIREIAQEEPLEGAATNHRIFATDAILAGLMSATRSVNSWDLSVEIMDDENDAKLVFFDKRDDFDLMPVNETSREPPQAEMAAALAEELALVNQRMSQQVLKKGGKKHTAPGWGPNPFAARGEDVASALYKYRQWKLDRNIQLIARCQLDGAMRNPASNKIDYYKVYTLNEYDPRLTDWRKKLESAAGAVLATEIKNNAFTLAKYTARAILAGANTMKLGYVARSNPQNRLEHVILQVQQYDPLHFARQNIALNPRNMWAILKNIVDACVKLPEGKYVLLKDPNKQMIHLYSVPAEADDDDDEGAEEAG